MYRAPRTLTEPYVLKFLEHAATERGQAIRFRTHSTKRLAYNGWIEPPIAGVWYVYSGLERYRIDYVLVNIEKPEDSAHWHFVCKLAPKTD